MPAKCACWDLGIGILLGFGIWSLGFRMKYLLMLPIWIYKKTLSRLMPPVCRFTPTCATYFLEALDRRGAVAGTALGVRRLCRCHPWGGSGYDPVPGPPETGRDR